MIVANEHIFDENLSKHSPLTLGYLSWTLLFSLLKLKVYISNNNNIRESSSNMKKDTLQWIAPNPRQSETQLLIENKEMDWRGNLPPSISLL